MNRFGLRREMPCQWQISTQFEITENETTEKKRELSMLRNVIATVIMLSVFALPATAQVGLPGDANGDGSVNGDDFDIWYANRFQIGTDVLTGDFNGDGTTDGEDFIVWNSNKFTTGAGQLQNVPEPSALLLLLVAGLLIRLRFRRNR